MRIIAGKCRGVKLFAPEGKDVRPTTDRIKETVFNILSSKRSFENASVLDLFSGSGALGIEAMSRGASEGCFCDKSPVSVEFTKNNLKKAGLSASVYCAEFRLALKKLSGTTFDFIFLDPPYASNFCDEAINLIEKYRLIAKNTIIIAEFSAEDDLHVDEKKYIIDLRKFGSTKVAFLELGE